ncbi:MAG: LD-carboxypeptidase [Butyrivibrio sp.]|nr:LD-carboxypeptidase [Butyrivibrio sp.]
MIRRPKAIKPGDTIGITAPSYGAYIEPYSLLYKIAVEKLKDRGYRITEGDTVHKGDGLGISTDPVITAKELMEFYSRDDIDAIISCGGGELMCETISGVDFDALKDLPPKWFIGYSDNTNFIFPLVTISNVQGIYGPCISGYAKEWEETEKYSFDILEGKRNSFDGLKRFVDPSKEDKSPLENEAVYTDEGMRAPYRYNADRELVIYTCRDGVMKREEEKSVSMDGILLGGCLDILVNLCGTRFDRVREFKKNNGRIIWVFEACDLSPMSIRRSLWNLREAGWLDDAKGFIIGRPFASWKQEMLGVDQYNAVTDILSPLCAPIIMDAEIGHIDPMLPLIIGAEATVTVKADDLNITYI